MKRLLYLFLLGSTSLFPQEGELVNQSAGAPLAGYQKLLYYSGSNLSYVCMGKSVSARTAITVTAASQANPASITATAHGLGDYATFGATATPTVCISGYTGNWAAANGCWTATTTSANAFTVPVDSSAFGAVTGTGVFTTTSPRWNWPQWSILKLLYDGSNNLIFQGWAGVPGGAGATTEVATSTTPQYTCSLRTSYGYR